MDTLNTYIERNLNENCEACCVYLEYTEEGELSLISVHCDTIGEACLVQQEALDNAVEDGFSVDWW